jgi:probable HAF family extracellular repeat protein
MRVRVLLAIMCAAAAAVGSEPSWGQVPGYTIRSVASGGGYGSSDALGLNRLGQVVGQFPGAGGSTHAFVWDPAAGLQDIGTLGGSVGIAWSINDAGTVVGYSRDAGGALRAFEWTLMTGIQAIGPLPFGSESVARQINQSGQTVVTALAYPDYGVLLWQNGAAVDIGAPAYSYGAGINDYGQVVGYAASTGYASPDHAFLWTPTSPNGTAGSAIDLGTLGGASSNASKVNSQGQVVGTADAADGYARAFLWDPASPNNATSGTMFDLGLLPGKLRSEARDVNDAGTVVGTSWIDGNYYDQSSFRAFVYLNGAMHDLTSLVTNNSGFTLNSASGINNGGQIVCAGVDAQGVSHALLLTPDSPETGPFGVTLLYDPTRMVKSGAPMPIKLQLTDGFGANVSSASIVVRAVSVQQVTTQVSGVVDTPGNAPPDLNFRYDATLGGTGGYIFNLSTKGYATGTYTLMFTATGDPTEHSASFQVK